jgi:hypothetical protein
MSGSFDGYFGVCPHCGRHDGYLNIGRAHWFFRKQHRVKWCAGSDLFSGWRDRSEDEQRRRFDEVGMGEFEDIEPVYPAVETPAVKPLEEAT